MKTSSGSAQFVYAFLSGIMCLNLIPFTVLSKIIDTKSKLLVESRKRS